MTKVYQAIAATIQAIRNCEASGNTEWLDRHSYTLDSLVREHLPSGSGFDAGTTLDLDRSTATRIVLNTSYHHMNDCGMYDGWTEHSVIITPAFDDIDIRVTGRNRNDIKEYIGDTFYQALTAEYVA